jgi:hypothetical protein
MEASTYIAVSPGPGPDLAFAAPAWIWAAPALLLLVLAVSLAVLIAADRRGRRRQYSLAGRTASRWKQALAGLISSGRSNARRPVATVGRL